MNIKCIKKVLFVFLIGITVFFINSSMVDAAETLCEYYIGGQKIIFYNITGTSSYAWRVEEDANCGKTIDNSCIVAKFEDDSEITYAKGASFKDKYITNNGGEVTCSTIYYNLDEQTSSLGKYKKKYSISHSEYKGWIKLNPGQTKAESKTNPNGNKCELIKQKLAIIRDKDEHYVTSNIKVLYDIVAKIKDKEDLTPDEYQSYYSSFWQSWNLADANLRQLDTELTNIENDTVNSCDSSIITEVENLRKKLDNQRNSLDGMTNAFDNIRIKKEEEAEQKGNDEEAEAWAKAGSRFNERLEEMLRANMEKYGYGNGSETCEGLLGPNVKKDINEILTWLRIIIPILVIVLGIVDFTKAVLAGDEKVLSKALSNLIKRAIIAVAIFFVPIIINYLLNLADKYFKIKKGCDVRKLFIYINYFK